MNWIFWALGSAVFATATTILSKVGVQNVPPTLATAIRTIVVLILAWAIVFWRGEFVALKTVSRASMSFLLLSGVATGLSWLCYFRALAESPEGLVGQVSALDKLSLPFTVVCAALIWNEHFGLKTLAGVLLIGGGTYLLIQK